MRHRALKRFLAVVAAPILAFFAWFAFAGSASAHDVTSITADCSHVTVHFANFPQEGVMVHISAQVGAQATLSKDVLVSAATTEAQLDISSETGLLAGATANVDVHVTWEFNGHQDVHATLSVTCGSSTSTTSGNETTTTSGNETTTTAGHETTTTTEHHETTTTTSGAATSTTVAGITGGTSGGGGVGTSGGGTVGVSGNTSVGAQTAVGATGAVGTSGTSGESSLASGTSATGPTSLAFTGNSTGPLVLAALFLLTIGSAALAFARRRTARA